MTANFDKNAKSAFTIKLSSETLQKINEQDSYAQSGTSGTDEERDTNQPIKNKKEPNQNVSESTSTYIVPQERPPVSTEQKLESSNIPVLKIDASAKDYASHITYENELAIYTDPSTQQKYIWDQTSASWVPKTETGSVGRQYSFENDTHIYTEPDGSQFFWDEDKKAWIPRVDEDFLARYQMSYGFVDNDAKSSQEDKMEVIEKKEKRALTLAGEKRKSDPQWFDASDDTNTKVYVSNLPLDITEEEFVNLMQKCGLVERDVHTQKMKVKLYMDKERDCFKGDALCSYIKIESVGLALNLLDGSEFKGNKLKVERAHFQLKGEYNPALKPKKKKKKELEKVKKMKEKLFDWRPEKFVGDRSKHERVVIIKNLFHPNDFDKDVQLILDYQQDLREECSKCGDVRKVVIYDRHPEGVAQVTMKDPEQADAVIQLINGRWFGKRQITAEIWDGRTKYRIAETDSDISKRIGNWDKFLQGQEENKSKETQVLDQNACVTEMTNKVEE